MNYRITDHAVDRYIERVRPGCDAAAARCDIERLLEFGKVVTEKPEWVEKSGGIVRWVVAGTIAFPLIQNRRQESWVVVTCIARGKVRHKAQGEKGKRYSHTGTRDYKRRRQVLAEA